MFDDLRIIILFLFGRIPEALTLAQRNQSRIEKSGSTWLVAFALDVLSLAQILSGDFRQAQATVRQAFALPNIAGKWIHHFLFGDLALAQLAEGAVTQAQQTLDEAPPAVGVWQELDRLAVRGLVALAQGETSLATELATALAERATAIGSGFYVQSAARLVDAIENPPPLAELPGVLWINPESLG